MEDADPDVEDSDVECCTLQAAVAVAESDNRAVDIVIMPPSTTDEVSDEEECDEDDISGTSLPSDVAGTMIVHFHQDNNDQYEDRDSRKLQKKADGGSKKLPKRTTPKWSDKCEFQNTTASQEITPLAQSHPELKCKSPWELFRMYYDDDVRHLITEESVRYARQKNNQSFTLSDSDLDVFMGIFLLSGYHSLPRERLYWCRDEDVGVRYVSSTMSRNRFLDVKRHLHLADNNKINKNDKLYKVSQFLSLINAKLQQHGVFSQYLSIDEQMVPYFGRHSAKMFIRSKPIRFGYKLWVLASDSGYPYKFDVYCGKSSDDTHNTAKEHGLGFRVVTSLLSVVSSPECHEVFFDNFFTSYDLLAHLQTMKIKASRTVRENRLQRCPLQDTKLMKKTPRGTSDSKCDGVVGAVKWHDNQCVTVATNYESLEAMGRARRWSSAKKALVDISQPVLINSYNSHMGGVDILDSFMANYRPVIRSKKWWWPLFVNAINMAVVAAWKVHTEVGGTFDQLSFRRHIVRCLLQDVQSPRKLTGPGTRPLDDVRTDGVQHHLVSNEKQARCRLCMKNCRLRCDKCDVPLHLHCERQYHAR